MISSCNLDGFNKCLAFGFVGAFGTGVHYSVLIALVEFQGVDPTLATSIGFVVGAATNYLLSHRYVFSSSKAHTDAGPKFFAVAATTGLLNAGLVHIGFRWVWANYLLAQTASTAVVFLANYVLNSVWTFRESGTLRVRS